MKKTKVSINSKIKYNDSENYNKHFTLDDRIKIQKIITEHRDENGNLTILLKDIGNMLTNDPFSIDLNAVDFEPKYINKILKNFCNYIFITK